MVVSIYIDGNTPSGTRRQSKRPRAQERTILNLKFLNICTTYSKFKRNRDKNKTLRQIPNLNTQHNTDQDQAPTKTTTATTTTNGHDPHQSSASIVTISNLKEMTIALYPDFVTANDLTADHYGAEMDDYCQEITDATKGWGANKEKVMDVLTKLDGTQRAKLAARHQPKNRPA